MKLRLKTIRKSHKKEKKWDAVFVKPDGKEKTVPFGARGMSDYTKHKDKTRKQRYINRHSGMGETFTDPIKAQTLSRFILWNKPTFQASLKDYKRRFKV